MTFRVGQLVVCVKRGAWRSLETGRIMPGPHFGDILRVGKVLGAHPTDGLPAIKLVGYRDWWQSFRFKPLIDQADDAELIARIQNCKPAPAQPHEADAQVRGDGNNSPAITPFAAAGDSTASNLVSPDPVETITHTDRTEGVTHRDLSQHADSGITDLNCFAPLHGA